jgi:hypothetical protein
VGFSDPGERPAAGVLLWTVKPCSVNYFSLNFGRHRRQMTKRIHKYFFYTLLTIVYGVFFSVEFFYNFDGHSEAKQLVPTSNTARYASGNERVVTSPGPLSKPHSMRLNKRYHQEKFPLCPVFHVEGPVVYVTPTRLGASRVRPLPEITVPFSLLRGPPFAA